MLKVYLLSLVYSLQLGLRGLTPMFEGVSLVAMEGREREEYESSGQGVCAVRRSHSLLLILCLL